MEKELYIKNCIRCQFVFRTDNQNEKVCPSCKEATKKKKIAKQRETYKSLRRKQKSKYKSLSLPEYVSVINSYNKQHKTNYSYGQFVLQNSLGNIK